MIKIAGMWEKGWTTPIMEVDLWKFMLNEFSVDEFIMTPVSGISRSGVTEYKDIDEVIHANITLPVVHVDASGDIDLADFEHPENVLYLFGSANHDTLRSRDRGHHIVRIPTISNRAGLWPHQAAAIVLYDRLIKRDRNGSNG